MSQRGSYATTPGRRTITVPTGGSVTLTVGTTNDTTGEADGSVTATVNSGAGYTVSVSGRAATVTVSDDDAPRVSISAGSGVTEGNDASFTITASPAPGSVLRVGVTVSQRGAYAATTGRRTVTVPTSGSVTLAVPTTDDNVDEADGSVTATVNSGSGYNVSASSGAATVSVADDEPDIVQCLYPGPENHRCLEIGVRYLEDETDPADAYELFYGGTTTPLPDLVRRSGDLYAQRVIYSYPVGPDGNDPDLERYYYAHEVCGDDGFDCTWTQYTDKAGYPIATDLVIRCAEGFRCTVNLRSQRHSATSTVRTTTEVERPPRPLNERVVPQAEGRQLYRVRANIDGNARDAARYAAVYEAVCTGDYAGVGATCEFFDHYYNDGDGTDESSGTYIGTTLVVTCDVGYDCDLDVAFADGAYTASFTPTYVEPGEQAPPRPVTARSSRASVGSVSVTEREVWVDANDDGVRDASEVQLETFINGRPNQEKQYRPEPYEIINFEREGDRTGTATGIFVCSSSREYGHPSNPGLSHGDLEVPVTNPDGTIRNVIPDIHKDPATGRVLSRIVYTYPNARGECPLQGAGGHSSTSTSADEYKNPEEVVGSRVQTITAPRIAEPEEPACLTAWRATKPTTGAAAIRTWSNTYTDHCSEAELDAHDRAQEQWSADHDATFGSEDYDPDADSGTFANNLRQPHEGNEGTYEQQEEQLWERGEPYYVCISEEEWAEQFQPAGDRCQLIIP